MLGGVDGWNDVCMSVCMYGWVDYGWVEGR